jgi:TM2 domain-containing membrane protein YozV
MICNGCGSSLHDNSKFCYSCGAPTGSVNSSDSSNSGYTPSFSGGAPPSVTSLFADSPASAPGPVIACATHQGATAAGACVGCGSFFCRDCMVSSEGRNYCRPCLTRHSAPPAPPAPHYQPQPVVQYSQPPQPYPYPQVMPQYPYPPAPYYIKRKEPGIALLLSFLFPGAGQFYNGDVGKGFAFLFGFWILIWIFGLGLIFWIVAMVDAYQSANAINMGRRY